MKANYTKITKEDFGSVVWLQLALTRLMPRAGVRVQIGELDVPTEKALRMYQSLRNLPVTGEPDETTLQKINQELPESGLTV